MLALLLVEAAPSTDLTPFAQYGAIGAMLVILIMFARAAYKRESDRADEATKEVARLNQVIQDNCIPALQESAAALREANRWLGETRSDPRRS